MKYCLFDDKGKPKRVSKKYPQRGIKEGYKVVRVPEEEDIEDGFEIYKSDGSLYATIIRQNEYFYYIEKPHKPGREYVLGKDKDNFQDYYLNGVFALKEDEENVPS